MSNNGIYGGSCTFGAQHSGELRNFTSMFRLQGECNMYSMLKVPVYTQCIGSLASINPTCARAGNVDIVNWLLNGTFMFLLRG